MNRVDIVSKHRIIPMGTTQIRCLQASEYLSDLGFHGSVRIIYSCLPKPCSVTIFHRVIADRYTLDYMDCARMIGNALVYDVDDLLFTAQGETHLRSIGKEYSLGYQGYAQAMRYCDAVTVSTPYLLEEARRINPNVFLLRNALSWGFLRKAEIVARFKKMEGINKLGDGYVTYAYLSGSNSHDRDFHIIERDLLRLLSECDNSKVMLVGRLHYSNDFLRFGDRFEYREVVDYSKYADLFAEIDVNLIPLDADSQFNHAKSELKYIEAGACSVPSVSTVTHTLAEVIVDHVNGLLVYKDWYSSLYELYVNVDLRIAMGEKARAHILAEYTPDSRMAEYHEVLKSVTPSGSPRWNFGNMMQKRFRMQRQRLLRFAKNHSKQFWSWGRFH